MNEKIKLTCSSEKAESCEFTNKLDAMKKVIELFETEQIQELILHTKKRVSTM